MEKSHWCSLDASSPLDRFYGAEMLCTLLEEKSNHWPYLAVNSESYSHDLPGQIYLVI